MGLQHIDPYIYSYIFRFCAVWLGQTQYIMTCVLCELLVFCLSIAPAFVMVRLGLTTYTYNSVIYAKSSNNIYSIYYAFTRFFRFPFGTRFQYFNVLFISLTTFVAWSCYCIALQHGKNICYTIHATRHGKLFAHIF